MITEKDGSIVNGSNLLPSAYFELNVKSGKAVQIQGKGYGHGVGMSQNGANEMAREGYGWQEILNYFLRILRWKWWGITCQSGKHDILQGIFVNKVHRKPEN